MSGVNLLIITAGLLAQALSGSVSMSDTPDYSEFAVSQLRCTIGNNAAMGEHHRGGYNGIFTMSAPGQDETPYVPFYAGFNLEHYFDSRPRHSDGNILFEPRKAPMEFRRLDDSTAELYQPATPHFGVESWTRFALKEPYYIDVQYRCVPHKDDLTGGFFGVFWASYMNAPINKSIYFLGAGSSLDAPRWLQFCTQHHDHYSTVLCESDPNATPFQEGDPVLWNQVSPLRYSVPFYYGRFRNRVLIYVFEPGPLIRFAHSPSGGGPTADETDTNPAWDFQFIVPNPTVGEEYGYRARVVYKPWVDRADVIAEVRRFLDGLEQTPAK